MLRFSPPYRLLSGVGVVMVCLFVALPSAAQDPPSIPDSLRRSGPSSAQRPSGAGPPSRPGSGSSGSKTGVQFSASDSLVIRMPADSADQGTLYGQAKMSYQGATLKAGRIQMNLETSVLRATGAPSDTATRARPTFQRGQGQSFTGQTLSYNLRTRRGRVVAARTQQRNGYVEGNAVKVFEDSTLFVRNGSYTTCNCPPGQTPSYSLRSSKMKVQGRWVYTGPIHLYLFNIPTPLWLPFGFLPNISGRRSGPLAPDYGQDREKGLFLRNFGWYFALNDYTDLQLQASVWSQGSYEINPIFRYRKRYNYNGRIDLTYRRTRIGEPVDPDFTNRHRGQLRWRHSQELSPTASIQGNINLATSADFARRNSNNYNDAVSQEISSNLRYSKNWPGGGKNLSISANQRQQLQSGAVSMTLPTLNFSQRSFKPFEVEQAVGGERWYEKITTSYDFSLDNRYSFRPRTPEEVRARGDSALADSLARANVTSIAWYNALFSRRKYRLATGNEEPFDLKATHRIPFSASFRVNRYNLSLSPNVRYSSDWHISTTRKRVTLDPTKIDPDSLTSELIRERTVERSVPGFYARRRFSTGISATTELYGLFPIRVGPLEGLRHRMAPSLSFNYTPNFNAPFWGRTRTLRYSNGTPVLDPQTGKPIRYDILGGNRVRGGNEQRTLSFNLDNELETKHVQVDSTGERTEETIKLLDFDLSTAYNFTADSLKLSDIDLRARTTIRDFSIRSSMTFSPYALAPTGPLSGRRYRLDDQYLIAENPLTPLRLTRFQLNVSGSFQNRGGGGNRSRRGRGRTSRPGRRSTSPRGRPSVARAAQQRSTSPAGAQSQPKGYLDASLPWSLRFNFNYSFRKPAKRVESQNATLNASFSLNVTPMWRLEGRSGYDLIQNEVATTSINISRDIGKCRCWVMSFSWVPFGARQSYSFNLQVKSGKLSQLLRLQIPNAGQDGPLGGFGNRLRSTVGGAVGGRGRGGGPF